MLLAFYVHFMMCGSVLYIGLTKGSLPVGQRRVKSQFIDNFVPPGMRSKKRISAPGLCNQFDPVLEKEESLSPVRRREVKDKEVAAVRAQARENPSPEKRVSSSNSEVSHLLDENEEWAKVSVPYLLRLSLYKHLKCIMHNKTCILEDLKADSISS